MSFLKKIFGAGTQGGSEAQVDKKDDSGRKLPGSMLAPEFGEVRVRIEGDVILIGLQGSKVEEGWQTGVALDASGSMRGAFGQGLEEGPKGEIPQSLLQEYINKGHLKPVKQGKETQYVPTPACEADLVERGYRTWSKNQVEPEAQKFTRFLADNLDADGGTTVIYWACGDGSQMEDIGDFTSDQCETASFKGPTKHGFGQRTVLTPAVKYFADRFKDAKNGMYVFVTDGELHDLEDVKRYTISLCKDIQGKRRNPLKCVLIGLGDSINEGQMEQLDDLDSGTDVDVWDHKIAKEMHNIIEIFIELIPKDRVVAPTGRILDASGNVVRSYSDGLTAGGEFSMPASSSHFVLDVAGKQIKQSVQMPAK
jgi:hypothetical protein